MSISVQDKELIVPAAAVRVTAQFLIVELTDGRQVSVPLAWYPRLLHGNARERANWRIGHYGIHWPDLDEDISIKGLLLGRKSGESQASLRRWLTFRHQGKKPSVKTLPLPAWAKPDSQSKRGSNSKRK